MENKLKKKLKVYTISKPVPKKKPLFCFVTHFFGYFPTFFSPQNIANAQTRKCSIITILDESKLIINKINIF